MLYFAGCAACAHNIRREVGFRGKKTPFVTAQMRRLRDFFSGKPAVPVKSANPFPRLSIREYAKLEVDDYLDAALVGGAPLSGVRAMGGDSRE